MQDKIPRKRVQLNLLQAFRGVAALLVILFHIDQLSNETLKQPFLFDFFKFGSAGVDYFLVLSGFVAIYAHWHELGHRSFENFKTFLLKRCIRIYPVYWIISLIVVAFFVLIPGFAKAGDLTPEFLFKSFILFPQTESPLLNVGWTLILIVFFYLVFSLVYLLPTGLYLGLVALLLIGSSTQFFSALSVTNERPILQLLTNALNLEFAFGSLAAWLVLKNNLPQRKAIFWVGSVLLLTFGILHASKLILQSEGAVDPISIFGITFLINRVLVFGIPCFLIVLGAASIDLNEGRQIPKFINYLGDASYSLYLMHSPIVSAMTKIAVKLGLNGSVLQSTLVNFVILAVAIAVSCLFYSFVEQPVVEFLRKRLIKKKAVPKTS
ncbi:acyltransferase [Oscillatoria sp. FACHB-1406]|uniref:acyltransferase family protein n=1 Tax=Oscillatoria sp. FACHB-1406 TaxID=2692846 RepID=UPI0016866889|nr:acyltransferase [Oscillatoria sp. FACHB-1406]MBD2577603.1 acyltransferase [Oscillatoria sp. FACHB-1406]